MDQCPFDFNFDPGSFAPGDTVSYRVPERFGELAFVGKIVRVFADHLEISSEDATEPRLMRATRESRPVVSAKEALGE